MTKLTRIGIPLMLLIGLGAFVYAWFSAASPNVTREGIQSYAVGEMSRLQFQRAGEPISEAEFQAPDGSAATLADYTGRILVVNFWGTTCAPCVLEMPTLAALQNEFDESDLLVMPLSFDRVGDYPMARERLEELTDGALDFYGDAERGVMFDSYIGGFPSTVIYDRNGREVARFEGDTDWASEEALELFRALVG